MRNQTTANDPENGSGGLQRTWQSILILPTPSESWVYIKTGLTQLLMPLLNCTILFLLFQRVTGYTLYFSAGS